ncbi:CapA family protein [Staphylococcus caprae]|uniref:Poly-gamma-glutamate synthesis protein CapA n=2 Tax=Staphylococcus TaxID=1279 RepID=A0ABN5W7B0_9STAP|nr:MULTISPECIES: CapA family protein [Staphylococcus]EES41710.1 bacterial capsule synthesis protein [Staphylococcus caprae M23864:W1]MBN6826284.1 CapA family protein [Staphylococcus caprae]MBX5317078.1 CapA family protein [Staphylococcus caprae]MBX5318598.1 CapA family protein [Staphylococcus caprae]MBX5323516.1 CapA family protein [Staphylococcus caprae]
MKKKKRLSPSEWLLKQSKRHKRRNTLYTAIVLLIALVLLVFAIKAIHVNPVKSDAKSGNSIRITYLGNITLNKHIRQNNLNEVFSGIQDTLKNSDFSTASLLVNEFSKDQKEELNKNLENIMFLRKQNIKSVNLINQSIDNIQATELMRRVESQAGYNFLTGNGSNPINSKTVQQEIKGKKIANVSFTDIESNYTKPLKNTTSISLDPEIFYPLIKKLKENNDYVVVNVDWGIPNERNVTDRQRQYAHALSDAGADVIIGHNSVVQKVEKYKKTPIFYSLGNTTSDDFLSKNQKGMIVQQDWNGKNNKFHITPIQSKDGRISKDDMNKMDHIRFHNNIKDKSINLKSDNSGGYTFEY